MSGIVLLAPKLDGANAPSLIEAARRKSKREIEMLLAETCIQPAVPDRVRQLPRRDKLKRLPAAQPLLEGNFIGESGSALSLGPADSARTDTGTSEQPALHSVATARHCDNDVCLPQGAPTAVRVEIAPLGAARFRIQLTGSERLVQNLERARALSAHRFRGDIGRVIEAALEHYCAALLKERFAVGATPTRDSRSSDDNGDTSNGERSRHIPNAVRRRVVERDGLRCTYRAQDGRRCDATGFLELDHRRPFALGGRHEVGNVRVLCRAHNQLRNRAIGSRVKT